MIIAAASAASAAVAAGAVVYSGRKKRRVELERVRRLNETAVRGSDTGKVADKKSILRAEVLRERLAKQLERRSAELAEDEARVQTADRDSNVDLNLSKNVMMTWQSAFQT